MTRAGEILSGRICKPAKVAAKEAASYMSTRRGAREVEWDGLENRCMGNCTEGSNPSLSAFGR